MAVDYSTTQALINDLSNYEMEIPKLLGLNSNNEAAMLDVSIIAQLVAQGSVASIPKSWVSTNSSLGDSDELIPTQKAIKDYVTQNAPPGSQGPQGTTGPQGATGAQGPQGSSGSNGSTGAQGAQGPQGVKGTDGTGVNILGSLASTSNLPTTGNGGDAYLVNGILYVWVGAGGDTGGGKWQSAGNIQGPQGATGLQGPQGASGAAGTPGSTGAQGLRGFQGATGAQGPQGVKGDTGNTGARGYQGYQGVKGTDGKGVNILGSLASTSNLPTTGTSGDAYLINGILYVWVGTGGDTAGGKWQSAGNIQGPQGATGSKGSTGPQGATGAQGSTGPQGVTGSTGAKGPQGHQGATGSQGPRGYTGDTGATGPQGSKGNTGSTGSQGPQGSTGPQGLRGYQGYQGATGAKGSTGSTGPQGSRGYQGYQGSTGPQGPAASNQSLQSVCSVGNSTNTTITAKGFYQDSDDRVKKYLGDYKPVLDIISSIPIRYFKYTKDSIDDEIRLGTSAQELEKVIPELVKTDKELGYKVVDYSKLGLVAIKALLELKEKLNL